MTPVESYRADLRRGKIRLDAAQAAAVRHTQRLYEDLLKAQPARHRFSDWLSKRLGTVEPVKGLYFWGGVGRGKTYLMDSFFACLPFAEKLRIHFHRFMHTIHQQLNRLKDRTDPLQLVAGEFARRSRIICFDEFHVADITDAMLLGTLLKALFDRGVILVATSNDPPDKLYWNGLQRERFLPAIESIKTHTVVINLDGDRDYRLCALEQAEIYHSPLDRGAEHSLTESFEAIAAIPGRLGEDIEVNGRTISTVRLADGVVWFEFNEICGGWRGPADYIEIAQCYQTVLISNIPKMDDKDNDALKRLITLVDEFYDRNVKLIVSADGVPGELYRGMGLSQQFQRTISRLEEMRSHAYLAKQHLP
jgi:cell division protein ZapE